MLRTAFFVTTLQRVVVMGLLRIVIDVVCALGCAGIGAYTLLKDISSRVNRTFFFFCAACIGFIGAELIQLLLLEAQGDVNAILFWTRINLASGFLALPLLLKLGLLLAQNEKFLSGWFYRVYVWAYCCISSSLFFSFHATSLCRRRCDEFSLAGHLPRPVA